MTEEQTGLPEAAEVPVLVWLARHIDWYRRKADRKMRQHQCVRIVQILVSFLITISAILLSPTQVKVIAGVLGAVLAALGSFAQTFSFQQHWIRWRGTQMNLEAERDLFMYHAGPYAKFTDPGSQPQKAALLVERCQNISGSELQQWISESAPVRKLEEGRPTA